MTRRWWWCLLVTAGMLAGCGRPQPPAEDSVHPEARPAPPPEPVPAPVPAPEPAPAPDALSIAAPAEGAVLPADTSVLVELAGPAQSGDALCWLDNGEPQRIGLGTPLSLGTLAPGWHLIRVVPLAGGALSTDAGALLTRAFQVGESAGSASVDVTKPLLTVAYPFGEVAPLESGEIPLELRLDGLVLDGRNRLRWSVDGGEAEELFEFPPPERMTIGPFEPGPHKIVLELVGADGAPIENGGLTRVERTFTVPAQEAAG